MENNEKEIKQTIAYNKEDIEKIAMALNQIPVSGLQNVMNLAAIFEILNNKGTVN